MVRFSNNQITISKGLTEASAYIFVADQTRKAGTNVADLSKKTILASARSVVAAAKRAPPGDVHAPLPKGPFQYDASLLDQKRVEAGAKDMMGWVRSAIDAALKEGSERVAGSLIVRNARVVLHTSGDVAASARKSTVELSIRAFGPGLASGHSTSVAASERDFRPEEAGREAGSLAKEAADAAEGEPGEYQAVLGPLVFADVAGQVGRLASAFYVDMGLSFLGGKVNQKIAADKFSITDDATMQGTYGCFPFDAEGMPTRRTAIVSQGVLKSYLHNSSTAKKFGTESTANAGLISPQPFNLVIDGGDKTLDELIASVDKGIYVTNNWYLRYQNYSTGDFSTIPRDAMFMIRNGKIEGSIKELRISDNILGIVQRVSALTRERRWVKWWEVEVPTYTPSALVDGLRFTKSSM